MNQLEEVENFTRDIKQRGLPIDTFDAQEFAENFMQLDPPPGLLPRLLKLARFVDKPEWDQTVEKMSQQAKLALTGPYATIYSDKNKSEYWTYAQLKEKGLPDASIELELGKEDFEKDDYGNPIYLKKIPPNLPIYVFDDFSIGGGQIVHAVFRVPRGFPKDRASAHVFLGHASNTAKQRLAKANINPILVDPTNISLLNEDLSQEDLDFLVRKIFTQDYRWDSMNEDRALFWAWHKVPDNVPPFFTGFNFPPLIKHAQFKPPYKLDSTGDPIKDSLT